MLTLLVPGLIWTRQALADLTCDLPLPAFATLLGCGRLRRHPPRSAAATLAELTGLKDPLPSAALRRIALGHPADDSDWLCLDPVRLHFQERSLIVDDPQQLALDMAESAALAVSLAPTFAGLGHLEVMSSTAWNLHLPVAAPDFQPLPEAAGRIAAPLPLDAAYAPWRHAVSEAQMILHAHPVNRAREAAGRPLVNSVWPWGSGRLPAASSVPACDALWSDDPVARGIASLLQIESMSLPAGFRSTAVRRPLAVFDAMERPARTGDAIVWRDELARFETDWLAPALDALRRGRIDAVRLHAPGDLGSAELTTTRLDLWKFWRKPGALTALGPA